MSSESTGLPPDVDDDPQNEVTSSDAESRMRAAAVAVLGHSFTTTNHLEVLRNGNEIFPAMLDAIRGAQRSIEFVTFVYWKGRVAETFASALAERARAGARVRVILDAFGSIPMDPELIEEMRKAGVVVRRFRPPNRWKVWEADHRTHRKILVCDGVVGFTGGVGIAEEWEGDARDETEWRDTHFRVEGPAVRGLSATFLTDWRDCDEYLELLDISRPDADPAGDVEVAVVDGSAQIGLNDAARLLEAVVSAARRRIVIQTPYFNPTDRLVDLLVDARRRSVEVDVMIPGPHIDKRISGVTARDRCRPLMAAGVRVWEFQPTMLHVKAVAIDGTLGMVGSVNVNRRSMEKDEEVALVVIDRDTVATLEGHFQEDRDRSIPLDLVEDSPSPVERAIGFALRPLRGEM